MRTLIKDALLLDPTSELHRQRLSLLIEDGVLRERGTGLDVQADEVVESDDLHVSAGWVDLQARLGEPGYEHKETLESGIRAAQNGGFTHVVVSPLTKPVIDHKAGVEYILRQAAGKGVVLHVAGSLSAGAEGVDISEMYDMFQAGAHLFTDGEHPVMNPDLMKRALLYSKTFGGLIVSRPNDLHISGEGTMNEGPVSTSLGLKGIPALAEELMVSRDLFLAEYCEAPIHISCLSSAASVALIRAAKEKGVPVTCDVAYSNLIWTDAALTTFDTLYKLNPPLRTEQDRQALLAGLSDGTIDAIVSDHTPQNIEEKDCEFDHAAFGMSGIETVFPLCHTHISARVELDSWITCLADKPRELLGLEQPGWEVGSAVDMTVFDPTGSWKLENTFFQSRSINNPAIGETVTGRVLRTFLGR